jgi:hypothetical protein
MVGKIMTLSMRAFQGVLASALLFGASCLHGASEGNPESDAGLDLDAGPMDAGFCVTESPASCAGLSLTLAPAPCDGGELVLSPPINLPFELLLSADCGTPPYVWNLVANSGALPPGVSLDQSGRLAGTATQPGVWFFEVIVTDGAFASVNGHYELAVTPH